MGTRGIARFGLCGWDYEDWRGPLYPESLPPDFRALPLLARFTQFMEVNVSHYRILPPGPAERWVAETPPDFTFLFKAWKGWTHEGAPVRAGELSAFRALLEPAAREGRLEGILVQLPPTLRQPGEALRLLRDLSGALAPHSLLAEVRDRALCHPDFYSALEEAGIGFVNVDLPDVRRLPTLTAVNTTPTGCLRLHGRNRAGWARRSARDVRYDHDYDAREIDALAETIEDLLTRCPRVLVGANNHFRAQAAAVVARLRTRIEGRPCAVPERLRRGSPAVAAVTTALPGTAPPDATGELFPPSVPAAEGSHR
ncbi:MAG: DUF72 domain-containing protein [Planctomycetota bacterium]|jgi:uncharacterized protein YecE (DUF72 family)